MADKPTLFLKYGAGRVAEDITAEMVRTKWLAHYLAVPAVRQFVGCADQAWLLTTAISEISAYD